jgi:hypothetical protein
MGSLYRRKYRAADGVLRESAVIWLKYRDALGVLRRESSGVEKEQEARRVLRKKDGKAEAGRMEAPKADRITVAQLAEDLKAKPTRGAPSTGWSSRWLTCFPSSVPSARSRSRARASQSTR